MANEGDLWMEVFLSFCLCVCEWERGRGQRGQRTLLNYVSDNNNSHNKLQREGEQLFYRSPFVFAVVIEGLMRQKNKAKA